MSRFQAIAPITAASTVFGVARPVSMIPLPTVFATAVVANAPTRFAIAAIRTAMRGESARVETDVATAFAVSWKPFVKSNASATTIVTTSSVIGYRFLTRIASRTSAAFSQASTASSSCSWMSFQRMIVSGSAPGAEEVGDRLAREPVALVLELAQRGELPLRVLEPLEPLDRLVQPRRRAMDHLGLLARLLRHVPNLVRVDVVGRLVDVVADVVDHRREPVHVVPVEGRHERPVEEVDHLVRQPVAFVLELADVAQLLPALGPVVQQVDEDARDVAARWPRPG